MKLRVVSLAALVATATISVPGTNDSSNVPVQVLGMSGVIAVAGGRMHSLALRDDGSAWAWGRNAEGQLGDGTFGGSNVPSRSPEQTCPSRSSPVSLPTPAIYYWKVEATNGCGSMDSPVWSFTITGGSEDILRYESKASLAAQTPESRFASGGLPWLDPDAVLEPGAPPMLFYDVTTPPVEINLVKAGATVIISAN